MRQLSTETRQTTTLAPNPVNTRARTFRKLKTPSNGTPPTASDPKPKVKIVAKIVNKIVLGFERLSQSRLSEGKLGDVIWIVRDSVVNTAYEKFGVRPQYSYRVQRGLPTEDVGLDRDQLKSLPEIANFKDPTVGALIKLLVNRLPSYTETKAVNGKGFWFHIEKRFTTHQWLNDSDNDCPINLSDFIGEISKKVFNDFDVILKIKTPADAHIGRGLNPKVMFTVADIGNEMFIPLDTVFKKDFTRQSPTEKAEFIVENLLDSVRIAGKYVKADPEIKQRAKQIIVFRYQLLDLIRDKSEELKFKIDPDELNEVGPELRLKIYEIAVKQGIIDPTQHSKPIVKTNQLPIRLFGNVLHSDAGNYLGVNHEFAVNYRLKAFLGSEQFNEVADKILPELDRSQPYEVELCGKTSAEMVVARSHKFQSYHVNFRQNGNILPAVIDIGYLNFGHPDTNLKFNLRAI